MKPNAQSLPKRFFRESSVNVSTSSDSPSNAVTNTVLRISNAAIEAVDELLRALLGIREFTLDPRCILRFSRAYSTSAFTLPNGECVRPGDPILELHFWNERVRSSPLPLRTALCVSFELLAQQMRTNECFGDVKAIHGTLARASRRPCRTEHRLGCTVYSSLRLERRRVHDFFEDILIHLLHWVFNPRGATLKSVHLNRIELWVSVSELKSLAEDQCQLKQLEPALDRRTTPKEQYAGFGTETAGAAGD
jgi:hypothetical protein